MTLKKTGHYAKKHPADSKVKPEIAEAVKQQTSNGEISCAKVHKIARDLKIPPSEVGVTVDCLEITLVKCQLGLFGYHPQKRVVKPAETVTEALKDAIQGSLVDGRLPCRAAWKIARKFGIGKMELAAACEALKIKISSCQLGAF